MSRYLLLVILVSPFVLFGILSTITRYKLGKITPRRFLVHLAAWIVVLAGVAFSGPLYNWLIANRLTDTDSLSLFDVVQITAIMFLVYAVNRLRQRNDSLERRLIELHQSLSIRDSTKN